MINKIVDAQSGVRHADMAGKIFGKLTCLSFVGMSGRHASFLFRCECGTEKVLQGARVNFGKTKSCGCIRKGSLRPSRNKVAEAHVGEVYGRLRIVAVERVAVGVAKVRSENFMRCLCACGNTTLVAMSGLRSGSASSCGCLHKEMLSKASRFLDSDTKGTLRFGWNFEGVRMRSGFEVMFAQSLRGRGIAFKYEPKCFVVGKSERYTPDFYIPSEDKYYELKGRRNEKQEGKIEKLRSTGVKVEMLFQKDLESICGYCYSTFRRRWCTANSIPFERSR